jgi:hypothetical protein
MDRRRDREAGVDDRLDGVVEVQGDVGDYVLGHEEHEAGRRHKVGQGVKNDA